MGHDREGADAAERVLRRWHASPARDAVLPDPGREHLRLGFMVRERPLDRRAAYRYLQRRAYPLATSWCRWPTGSPPAACGRASATTARTPRPRTS